VTRWTRSPVRTVNSAATLVMAAALLAAAPSVAGAAEPSHPVAKKVHTVIIEGLQYRPRVLVVRRGEPVTWINRDFVPHTVTAAGGSFDSHGIAPNGSWTYVPKKPGEYDYTCTFHPTMKGKLEVR
jgi:plastocyanin